MTSEQESAIRNISQDLVNCMATTASSMHTLVETYEDPKHGEPWPLSRLEIPGMQDLVKTYSRLSKGLWSLKETFPDACKVEHPHGGPDMTQAWTEGWHWCHYEEDAFPQIQRCDDPSSFLPCLGAVPRFDCDEAAARFVKDQADKDPEGYHAKILAYLFTLEKQTDEENTDL